MSEGYFAHDDWLNFIGGFIDVTVRQGRELTGLFTDMFSFITVSNSYLLRIIAIIGLTLYAWIIFGILINRTSRKKAFMISLMTVFITPIVNVVSYGVMFIYPFAFVLGAISVILYQKSFQYKNNSIYKYYCLILGTCSICIGNLIYQVATMSSFFVLCLYCIYNRSKNKKQDIINLFYIPFFITSTGLYFIIVRALAKYYQTEIDRNSIVSNFNQIVEKITWFFGILSQNIKQLISSFMSVLFYQDLNLTAFIYFKYKIIGFLLYLIIIFTIVFFLLKNFRKRFLALFTVLSLIPLSYYCFLILTENGAASYYYTTLCSILLILCVEGAAQFCDKLQIKLAYKNILLVALLVMEMFSANLYQRLWWINGNSIPFEYILHELEINDLDSTKWIHIYGTVRLRQADSYAVHEVQRALQELGIEDINEYRITCTSNKYYPAIIEYSIYNNLRTDMTEEELLFLDNNYVDVGNGTYEIKNSNPDSDLKADLYRIFVKADAIPENGEAICITLNMY